MMVRNAKCASLRVVEVVVVAKAAGGSVANEGAEAEARRRTRRMTAPRAKVVHVAAVTSRPKPVQMSILSSGRPSQRMPRAS